MTNIEKKCVDNKEMIIKYKVENWMIEKYLDLKIILSDKKYQSFVFFTNKYMGIKYLSYEHSKTFELMFEKMTDNDFDLMLRSEKVMRLKQLINN